MITATPLERQQFSRPPAWAAEAGVLDLRQPEIAGRGEFPQTASAEEYGVADSQPSGGFSGGNPVRPVSANDVARSRRHGRGLAGLRHRHRSDRRAEGAPG